MKVHGEIVSRASRTCKDPNAVHVIANQGWHGKNSDLAGRLIEGSGLSRRIVEGPEDTPQLLQKADGRR